MGGILKCGSERIPGGQQVEGESVKNYKESYQKKVKFVRAELYEFNPLKLPRPFWDSTGGPFETVPADYWLVLYNQDGTAGQCPCSGRIKQLLKLILNGEMKTYQAWYQMLYWSIRNNGFSGESAVELGRLDLAFHDMLAKEENLPLHRFLGAKRDWVHVYASGCGTNLTEKQLEEEVKEFIDGGYTTFKMKIASKFGTQLAKDVERVKMVRSLIGKEAKLALDANQLWKAEEAMTFAEHVEKYDIAWFEEPVQSYDMTELEKLARISPIPIGMGESPRCYYPMESYVKAGVSQLQPIPTNLSSVEDWMRTKELAHKNGLELTSGGFSHLTASFIATGREEDMVEYLIPVMRPFYEIMELRPEEKDGKFFLPSEPGISISPDLKRLERAGCLKTKEYL